MFVICVCVVCVEIICCVLIMFSGYSVMVILLKMLILVMKNFCLFNCF